MAIPMNCDYYDKLTDEDIEWLKSNGLESKSGGESYIETIITNSPASIANIEVYAKKIRELSVERKLLAAADEIKELITNKVS